MNLACLKTYHLTQKSPKIGHLFIFKNCPPEVNLTAIVKNGRHFAFFSGQSNRINKHSLKDHHAKFGACITLCTIPPQISAPLSIMSRHITKQKVDLLKSLKSRWPPQPHFQYHVKTTDNPNRFADLCTPVFRALL